MNLYAQPGGGSDDTQDVPIDGGVSLLMAAGIGYGAKKMKDAYKGTKQKKELNS
ncbi:MAG: PID-CTERM protein-sorting domain-containing protein [Sphingobacteriaceae bacterium]